MRRSIIPFGYRAINIVAGGMDTGLLFPTYYWAAGVNGIDMRFLRGTTGPTGPSVISSPRERREWRGLPVRIVSLRFVVSLWCFSLSSQDGCKRDKRDRHISSRR
jgi:hypothetical protein